MIETLRREIRNFADLAAKSYDALEANPDEIRNILALQLDNRSARENPVRAQESFFFPEVHAWGDEIATIAGLDRLEYAIPIAGYDAFVPYNIVNIGRPGTVAQLQNIVASLPKAYFRMQVKKVMQVLRLNPLAFDGQNFFSAAHAHPQQQGTFSNVLLHAFGTPGAPTAAEVKSLINRVKERFTDNLSIQSEVIDGQAATQGLVVIVHNTAHWSMFEEVRTLSTPESPNPLKGTFKLFFDRKSTVTNGIEFVLNDPGVGKVAFFVNDQDPKLEAWEHRKIQDGYVAVGIKGQFGVKPYNPLAAIQATTA